LSDATEVDVDAARRLELGAAVILYDPSWAGNLLPGWFDYDYWEQRAAVRGRAGGRGTTWFVAAAAEVAGHHGWLFDLRIEDQDHTAEQLARGEVLAAVTALAAPLRGCRSLPLGALRYRATASPAFVQRHFAAGVDAAALASAPCLVFNRQDRLQDRWMAQQLGGAVIAPPRHWLPSTQGFIDAARAGLGWGLNPEPLVRAELEAGTLQELVPGAVLDVPLHWQQWRAAEALLTPLTQAVRRAAATVLQPAAAAGTSTMKENA
jgi:LysR family transcriptional regulator (chromosome initiation inhibitor)